MKVSYAPCETVFTYWETVMSYDAVVSVICGFPVTDPIAVIYVKSFRGFGEFMGSFFVWKHEMSMVCVAESILVTDP